VIHFTTREAAIGHYRHAMTDRRILTYRTNSRVMARTALKVIVSVASMSCLGCSDDSDALAYASPTADAAIHEEAGATQIGASNDAGEDLAASPAVVPDWQPLAPGEDVSGSARDAWVVEWARWHFSADDCIDNAYFDPTGAACAIHQTSGGPVFFLEAGEYPTTRTECVVPDSKAILVPLVYFIADGRELGTNQTPAPEDLAAQANEIMRSMRDFRLDIGGVAVSHLEYWSVPPSKFDLEIGGAPNYFSCPGRESFEGTLTGFVSGVFVAMPSPGPGSYVLRYGGTLSLDGFDIVNDVTATLNVR
jgi:hypothetical protein